MKSWVKISEDLLKCCTGQYNKIINKTVWLQKKERKKKNPYVSCSCETEEKVFFFGDGGG